jgi:transcription elongation factor Elf1
VSEAARMQPKRKRGRGRPRRELPVVPLKLPRCPRCKSTDFPVVRPLVKFEGYLRHVRQCQQCGEQFECVWD